VSNKYLQPCMHLFAISSRITSYASLQFGTAVHEIGHALGLWHTQQRSDRDESVIIIEENIKTVPSQFWKHPTKAYGCPYDFGSVMQYSWSVSRASGSVLSRFSAKKGIRPMEINKTFI